jgi:DNA topoisomerase VI subunit B
VSGRLRRAVFATSRLLDFFSEKELVAQVGHPAREWPLVVLKELLDNALDECEEAGVAPLVEVVVDAGGITVSDNGRGIPPELIERTVDFSLRVSSREAYVSPTRGAQGNALKTLIAIPFVADPAGNGQVEIEALGLRHRMVVAVDRIRQEPVVEHEQQPRAGRSGTRVRVRWPDSA